MFLCNANSGIFCTISLHLINNRHIKKLEKSNVIVTFLQLFINFITFELDMLRITFLWFCDTESRKKKAVWCKARVCVIFKSSVVAFIQTLKFFSLYQQE